MISFYRIRQKAPTFFQSMVVVLLSSHFEATAAEQGTDITAEARQRKAELEAQEHLYLESHDAVVDSLDAFIARVPEDASRSTFKDESAVLVKLKQAAAEMLPKAIELENSLSRYKQHGAKYAELVATAPTTFRTAKEQFLRYAAEEPFIDYRKQYEDTAEIFELLAVRCEGLPSHVATHVAAAEELHVYVHNGRLFLTRFKTALEFIPEIEVAAQLDADDVRLRTYARAYERFRGALHKLRVRMHQGSPSLRSMEVAGRSHVASARRRARTPLDQTSPILIAASVVSNASSSDGATLRSAGKESGRLLSPFSASSRIVTEEDVKNYRDPLASIPERPLRTAYNPNK